jgi:hypothetical protein
MDDEDELAFETRAEVYSRAWAAWRVAELAAEDTLTRDLSAFGPQSFGLIAFIGSVIKRWPRRRL